MAIRIFVATVALALLAPGSTYACDADLDGSTTIVSEQDEACFLPVDDSWYESYDGLDGFHWYTYCTDEAVEETAADWIFNVSVPGEYLLEVHIPDADADSHSATYEVHHADGTATPTIDQSSQKGWVTLGTYRFVGSTGELLHLADNTGEDYSTYHRKLAYDAIRFTYQDPGDDDDDDTASGDDDDDTSADDDDDHYLDHLVPPPDTEAQGCQCAATSSLGPGGALAALVLGAAALRRRHPRT